MLILLAVSLLAAGIAIVVGALRMPESTWRFILWTLGSFSVIAGVIILGTMAFAK